MNRAPSRRNGPNAPPTAAAGSDQAVEDTDGSGGESITLFGAGSTDSDGTITSYSWQGGGVEIATDVNPTLVMAVGTHDITLTVTDNGGHVAIIVLLFCGNGHA